MSAPPVAVGGQEGRGEQPDQPPLAGREGGPPRVVLAQREVPRGEAHRVAGGAVAPAQPNPTAAAGVPRARLPTRADGPPPDPPYPGRAARLLTHAGDPGTPPARQ